MNKINRYLDSLLDLPFWIGFPIFFLSVIVPLFFLILTVLLLMVKAPPWFLLLPVVIWAVCAINWWIKNKDK